MQAPTTTTTTTTKRTTTRRSTRPQMPARPCKVRHLYDETYWVESLSYPGSGHRTTPHTCTCPAGRWGRLCRHVKIVRAYHAWRMQQLTLAQQQPEPQTPSVPVPQQRREVVELSSFFE